MIVHSKKDTFLAKKVATEYFMPLMHFFGFLKYVSSAKERSDELHSKINSLETSVKNSNEMSIAFCNQFMSAIDKQNRQVDELRHKVENTLSLVNEQNLYVKHIETKLNILASISRDLDSQRSQEFLNDIDSGELRTGMRKLKEYCNDIKPDYVIGLNRGGVMIGAFLALSMEVPSEKFLRCCVIDKNNVTADFGSEKLSGKVVIIDDIARSGTTLDSATDHLVKLYPDVIFYPATIFSVVDENGEALSKSLAFSVFSTKNEKLTLPWSSGPVCKSSELTPGSDENLKPEFMNEPISKLVSEVCLRIVS